MQKNSENFSMQEAMRLAQSPAGKELIATLRRADNAQLQAAASQAAAGDYESAKKALLPLLNSPEIQALMKQLGG